MFLVELVIANLVLVLLISIYCKLSTGICKCSKHLVGKVVIVTGANTGIGYETAKNLAERGARVILACRNESKGNVARDEIISLTGNRDVHFERLDLASFASIRNFVENVQKNEKRIDVLINNAGIVDCENKKTEDGLLEGMQINHFGPFLLTNLLLPVLKRSAPSRIIFVSSTVYNRGEIILQDLNMESGKFNCQKLYATTKLCNVLATVHLAELLDGSGVTVNCLHPGFSQTSTSSKGKEWIKTLAERLLRFFIKDAWEGAQTSIFLAVSPELSNVNGKYFRECRQQDISIDFNLAKELWEASEELVKIKPKENF